MHAQDGCKRVREDVAICDCSSPSGIVWCNEGFRLIGRHGRSGRIDTSRALNLSSIRPSGKRARLRVDEPPIAELAGRRVLKCVNLWMGGKVLEERGGCAGYRCSETHLSSWGVTEIECCAIWREAHGVRDAKLVVEDQLQQRGGSGEGGHRATS